MAIIGRLACTLCGFEAAHVKCNDGKRPFHHCPDCGVMTHTKSGQQERLLRAKMRPLDGLAAAAAEPVATVAAAAPARPAAAGFWSQLGGR